MALGYCGGRVDHKNTSLLQRKKKKSNLLAGLKTSLRASGIYKFSPRYPINDNPPHPDADTVTQHRIYGRKIMRSAVLHPLTHRTYR